MSMSKFPGWLETVVKQFSNLEPEQQTDTLNQLISCCGSQQLWHLQQKLPDFLYRDFINLLPPELTEKILSNVSPRDLLYCCSVSKLWKERIESLSKLWQETARKVGCNVSHVSSDWRLTCIEAMRVRNRLDNGMAWSQDGLVNLVRPPGRFSALDWDSDHIAGGTADSGADTENSDSVVIWSLTDNRVTVSFHVSSSVSCIKLQYPQLVVCGHFDGTLSCHSITGTSPGSLIHKFKLHTAPVLSLALAPSLDILASGSADCSTKIWCLKTGQLMKTLSNQSHWVLSCILSPALQHQVSRYKDRHLLLTMTRDDIQLWSWKDTCLVDVSQPDLYIPLKSVTEAIQSFFFTPGLHFDGISCRISFIRQMPMFDTQTIGDADIVILDANSGKVVQNVHVNQKIRKLLAIGSRFAVLLLPYVDNKYKNLAVVDLERREMVGGAVVPHSRASTPDFSQISLGDTRWCDGLNFDGMTSESEGPNNVSRGMVAALALADSSIQIVNWRDENGEMSDK